MNEPSWWVHDHVIVPRASCTRRLEHEVDGDGDPDLLVWRLQEAHNYMVRSTFGSELAGSVSVAQVHV